MEKKQKFVSYDKASKSEKRIRDERKRSNIKIPPNQVHKSIKDYDRRQGYLDIDHEMKELEDYDE